MPYTRKTSRRPARHVITLKELSETNWQVTAEMECLGLWCRQLDNVDVWLVPLSFQCFGWFQPEGDIYIPAVNGANLSDLITGHHTRLSDVLRHEWAHALADRRPKLVESKRFRSAFDGPYESSDAVWEYHPDLHLTPYAAASPSEDFAETFHHFLRHKGRLPVRLRARAAIVQKWHFIHWMAEQISRTA